jgi:hypothetical protein
VLFTTVKSFIVNGQEVENRQSKQNNEQDYEKTLNVQIWERFHKVYQPAFLQINVIIKWTSAS